MDACMYGLMDGCISGKTTMAGWVGGWWVDGEDGWLGGWMDGWVHRCMCACDYIPVVWLQIEVSHPESGWPRVRS